MFDDGYEAYREWVLARMIERGVLPADTDLTALNPMPDGTFSPTDEVRPWDDLNDDEKHMFSRMAEVFAGFSEYTDAQVGRIVDYLEESGQLDNTLIIYCADNGASGEGSPNGSVNEGKIFGGYTDDEAQNLTMVDKLGSPDTYNHYPTGWAAAFSTPYKMFKRYTYQGGVCDPLVIHWPAGMKARGGIRHQYHHSTDIVPTILEACGVTMPDTDNGVEQTPLSGVSMRYSFDAPAEGPTAKQTQYYEMFGQRGLWHQGWKAVSVHGPVSGMGNFDDDVWELYHADVDRAEAHDLAAQHPEKLEELKALWMEEAKANNVLPLNDLQIIGNPKDFETFMGWSSTSRCHRAVSTSTTREPVRCRSGPRPTYTACRTRFLPRSTSLPPPRASSSHSAHDSVGTACSSRTGQSRTHTTSSASRRRLASRRPSPRRAGTSSGWSSRRRAWAPTARASARCGCTSTTSRWASRRSARCWDTSRCAVRVCASDTTVRTRFRALTRSLVSSSGEAK